MERSAMLPLRCLGACRPPSPKVSREAREALHSTGGPRRAGRVVIPVAPVETCPRTANERTMDNLTIDKQGEKLDLDRISAAPPKKADKDEARQELDALG